MSRDMGLRAWDGEQFLYFSPMTLAIDAVEGEGLLENASAVYALIRKAGRLDADRSTGLRDKNDITIFEGDIVRHHTGATGLVGFGKYVTDNELNEDIYGWIVLLPLRAAALDPQGTWEVIGNVHQNPELAEVRS